MRRKMITFGSLWGISLLFSYYLMIVGKANGQRQDTSLIILGRRSSRSLQLQEEQATPRLTTTRVSYVIEPFEEGELEDLKAYYEATDDTTAEASSSSSSSSSSSLKMSRSTTDAYIGHEALRVEYDDHGTGGRVVLESSTPAASPQQNKEQVYNLLGANFLSLWYQYQLLAYPYDDEDNNEVRNAEVEGEPSTLNVKICLANEDEDNRSLVWWEYQPSLSLIASNTTQNWKEIWISLIPSAWKLTTTTNSPGDGDNRQQLQLDQIRSWKMEFHSTSTGGGARKQILLDHLTAIGDGNLLLSGLLTSAATASADAPGTAATTTTTSTIATEVASTAAADVDNSLTPAAAPGAEGDRSEEPPKEEEERIGGLATTAIENPNALLSIQPNIQYQLVPQNDIASRSYYNLSQAKALTLDYEVVGSEEELEEPSTTTLRLWVLEKGATNVGNNSTTAESYYSFYDLEPNDEGRIVVDLEWDNSKGIGNNQLDRDSIKGLQLEWIVMTTGEPSSSLHLTNLRAIGNTEYNQLTRGNNDNGECSIQPELQLILPPSDSSSNNLKLYHDDISNWDECCSKCQEDPTCLFAMLEKNQCYYTDHIKPDSVRLGGGGGGDNRDDTPQLLINNGQRGDFCTVCDCQEPVVDCRGRSLRILPDLWNNQVDWKPHVLDLRQNPDLTLILPSQLPLSYLREIRLPGNLTYFDPTVALELPKDCNIIYESNDGDNQQNPPKTLINAVPTSTATSTATEHHDTTNNNAFSDVCCGKGQTTSNNELSFCDFQSDYPGVDASYEPDVRYHHDKPSDIIAEITPTSSFLFEAAYSAEKCAAYCDLDSTCGYFTYDNRHELSEPTCYLMSGILDQDMTTIVEEESLHHQDNKRTTPPPPGYVSGRVARTRCQEENARVIIETTKSSKHLLVQKEELNGFDAHYTVRLGSTPLRGAVWVEPKLLLESSLSSGSGSNYDIGGPQQGEGNSDGHGHDDHGHDHAHNKRELSSADGSGQGINIAFFPPRIALYDNETVATVHLVISVEEGVTLLSDDMFVILNDVQACDRAFSASGSCIASEDLSVFLHVISDGGNGGGASLWAPIVGALAVAIVLGGILVLYLLIKDRAAADDFWKVDISELRFGEKPQVLGRGNFGLVLLAEYRGTQVAVKKVIKLEKGYRKTTTLFSAFFEPSEHSTSVQPFGADLESGLMAMSSRSVAVGNDPVAPKAKKRRSINNNYESSLKAFIREMRVLSKLRHPCVSSLMGAVVEKDIEPMILMEYMDQGSLFDLLHNETVALENEQLVPILRDIIQGMRFLHASDPVVIHGDLKAQNVLVDSKFRAKVADFGLTQKSCMGVTGTPYWLAPEILRGESKNCIASDVFAFGILLYEVLSRKEPYEGEDFESVLLDVAHGVKRPPVLTSATIPVQTMYLECVDQNATDRPSFAALDNKVKSIDALFIETPKEEKIAMSITLSDIFPQPIAEALQRGEKVEPQHHDIVTIFFSDIVGFTNISQSLSPLKVSDMLDRLYLRFDELSQEHEVFKVETIGDAWMGVTNLIKEQPDHAKRIARFAIDARKAAAETLIDTENPDSGFVQIRVGFHSGPVVSNVVGSRNPRFCLFGDTVNTASRMESTSENGKIHCSAISAELLQLQDPELYLSARGRMNIKGKGEMFTFFVSDEAPFKNRVSFSTMAKNGSSHHSTRDLLDSSFQELMRRSKSTRRVASSSFRENAMAKSSKMISKSFRFKERGRRSSMAG